ncbi:MAG: hypothetical protein RL211_604 [Pseudomonadota bacterium]|jgi:hypothetical protein
MPKKQSNSNPQSSIKPFPTRQLLLYIIAQIGLGLLLSIINLENIQWLKELLAPMENVLPTFRTAFEQSQTPVASKTFLGIWWLVILPWGFIFISRWSDGFKPQPTGLEMSYFKMSGYFVVIVFTGYMLATLLSFHDYSHYWAIDKPDSPTRGDIVPALMSNGALTLSIWCAISSFLLVPCAGGVCIFLRTLFCKIFKR